MSIVFGCLLAKRFRIGGFKWWGSYWKSDDGMRGTLHGPIERRWVDARCAYKRFIRTKIRWRCRFYGHDWYVGEWCGWLAATCERRCAQSAPDYVYGLLGTDNGGN